MNRSLGWSLALLSLLVGCSATPLTPTGGGGGFGIVGKKGAGGSTGAGAGPGTPIPGDGGAAGPSGVTGSSGGPSGFGGSSGGPSGFGGSSGGPRGAGGVLGAAGFRAGVGGVSGVAGRFGGFAGTGGIAGASGTGGSPVDASVPDPWTFQGQRVTKIDVTRCAPFYGCDVCTLTLAGDGGTVVPNLNYALPTPACDPPPADAGTPPADAGTDASMSVVAPFVPPSFCELVAPDGGASEPVSEIVLQPEVDAAPVVPGVAIPNAYCQLLPGPTMAWPHGCILTTLENDFCVPSCYACP